VISGHLQSKRGLGKAMSVPARNIATAWPILLAALLSWVVSVCGLWFLHKSCYGHINPAWAIGAGLPASAECYKVYRSLWFVELFELIIVGGLVACLLRGSNAARRWRTAWVAMLAANAVFHFYATGITWNLTDTLVAHHSETSQERLRARVASVGFVFGAILSLVLVFLLGEDDIDLGLASDLGTGTGEPLLGERGTGARTEV